MNGYNFTERVRRVLANSRAAAVNLNHEYVGTEHILVGLAEEAEGVSAVVLEHLGVNREAIVAKVREVVTPGADTRVGPRGNMITPSGRSELPYTSRAKKVLELSVGEARMLQHSYVGTEHLLLGLIAEDSGIGAQILKDSGATLEKARAATFAIVGTERVHPTPPDALIGHPTSPGYARSRSPYGVALVDDFTGRARDALRAAYMEAHSRDHSAVELSHVLLALASREDGMAAVLLDQVVGSRKLVVEALVERLPDKEENAARRTLQISAETQQALDNALIEASKDGHRRAGTQHLLLAVLDILPLALAAACAQLGLTAKATRTVYERMRE